ncbi:GNAT family N-acetyltransferase [Streptomyces sp. NPDC059862]|uniref:GNAT family N-acetyltransferase n=1 Tax=unclassified Streptomyces TaxID=2593676 RepID=UPI0036426A50
MPETNCWLTATPLQGERLHLEPLLVAHAEEAAEILNDKRLHEWIGGTPPTREELEQRYRRQVVGRSPDGRQGWLNWMMRKGAEGQLVGTVQATLYRPRPDRMEAELAWVVGHAFQGVGYGKEGASTAARWLRTQGVAGFVAHVHPGHRASAGIARALGMKPTGEIHDSEMLWADFDPRERPSEY